MSFADPAADMNRPARPRPPALEDPPVPVAGHASGKPAAAIWTGGRGTSSSTPKRFDRKDSRLSLGSQNSIESLDDPSSRFNPPPVERPRHRCPTWMPACCSLNYSNCREWLARKEKMHTELSQSEQHKYPRLRRFVVSQRFEFIIAALIIFNCVFIGWSANQGRNPSAAVEIFSAVVDQLFTMAFAVELALQCLVRGWTYLTASQNWLDVFLVMMAIIQSWIFLPASVEMGILRKLTVLRTLRLVRLARAVRLRPEFKEMWSLLRGLTDSAETLFWTYIMIGCVLYFFAIVATSLIGKNEGWSPTAQELADEYFGDVWLSMLTLFQIMTLDSWTSICRPLMAEQAWIAAFFIFFISVSVFLLMNLITAVIVENAFASGEKDKADVASKVQHEKEAELAELKEFFEKLDIDGSGTVTLDELHRAAKNKEVKIKLRALGIGAKDLDSVWESLDDGDGELTPEEFINGMRRMKGDAAAKDILYLYKEQRTMERQVGFLEDYFQHSRDRMRELSFKIRTTERKLESVRRTLCRAKESVKVAAKTQRVGRGDK